MRHATQEALVLMGQFNIQAACQSQESMLRAAVISNPSYAELPMNIDIIDNEIAKGDGDIAKDIPIEVWDSEMTAYVN